MYRKSSKTKEPANEEKAYEYAVFLLSLKLRTVGEVLKKMQDRGYTEMVIEKTIEQLKAQNYLNDERYAEIFLENLKTYKNFGFYGIQKKFMEKRIPKKLIEKTLKAGLQVEEELKIGKRLLQKEGFIVKEKASDEIQYTTFDEDASKEKQKMANRLKSRGFRGEVISRLLF